MKEGMEGWARGVCAGACRRPCACGHVGAAKLGVGACGGRGCSMCGRRHSREQWLASAGGWAGIHKNKAGCLGRACRCQPAAAAAKEWVW